MAKPTKIVLLQATYDKLFALTKWYGEMPKHAEGGVGERFHENVHDMQMELLPNLDGITNDEFFFENVKVKQNTLTVQIVDSQTNRRKTIPIVVE